MRYKSLLGPTTPDGRLTLIPPALQPPVECIKRREQWEDRVAAAAMRNPAEALGTLLIGGAAL